MAAILEDIPLDARGEERDRLVVAQHEQPVAEWLQLDRHLAELGPWRELETGNAASREDAHECRAPGRLGGCGWPGSVAVLRIAVGNRALESIGHRHSRPARLDGHRSRPVALTEWESLAFRGDREVSRPGAAENVREDGRRVRPGVAEPGDPGIGAEQRHR